MDNIQESRNSIFYIADQTKIIQYNLLSKRKEVIHTNTFRIERYLITDKHKIIVSIGNKIIYWNNKLIHLDAYRVYHITFLSNNNQVYVYCIWGLATLICSNQKIITINEYHQIYGSQCGKRFMVYCKGHWYVKNTPSYIEDNNKTNLCDYFWHCNSCCMCYWIDNSDILIKNYWPNWIDSKGDNYTVYNIETRKKLRVSLNSKLFDGISYLIVQNQQTILIYDIKTMDLLNTIQFPYQIIFYHKQLNIAITQDLDYYIINKYELQKINLGINYNKDMTICPNQIMDIIIDNNLIDIPNDILYCEFYQLLIEYFSNI